MWYVAQSKKIKVDLLPAVEELLFNSAPEYLLYDRDNKTLEINCNQEGFSVEEIEEYLKCATEKGRFKVSMEDHKGDTHFFVHYGPGECFEED